MSKEQTAYINRSRDSGTSARLIIDIFEHYENNSEEGLLLFLDFEKAFESIEWKFLFKPLGKFNFLSNFIKWINIQKSNISNKK